MLVLSRRPGESIIIGGDVVVTIVEVRCGQVRVGIEAPRDVEVHREEVFHQVAGGELPGEAADDASPTPGDAGLPGS